MYVVFNKDKQTIPIKIWTKENQIEDSCMQQAINLANLPFLHKWVALMPDTHTGMGMPIGGVIASDGVIIPNAVGSDIGCGMAYVQTNIKADELMKVQTASGSLLQCIIGDILRNIPVGFSRHKQKQGSEVVDKAIANPKKYTFAPELYDELQNVYYQAGTLGGGNHFIEIQEDENGYVGIMLHSGSRNIGARVCNHFHKVARDLNIKWHTQVPDHYKLAFLPSDSIEGEAYINFMQFCLDFAHENRDKMMDEVQRTFTKLVEKHLDKTPEYSDYINCHHNYAALEHHWGRDVWVHRKGAIRAREEEIGIIPGAMGSSSYIVKGKGNIESFMSCSHGAGRRLSRTKAKETFSVEQVMTDIKSSGMVLGKHSKKDVAEEYRLSYKDIDEVLENEKDLVEPIKKLKTLGVVKG